MTKEIWKAIKGHEGAYEVSDYGNVRSLDRVSYRKHIKRTLVGKVMAKTKHTNGYIRVTLYADKKSKDCRVHRLVASAFIPNPKNLPEVNHKDKNLDNNRASNLEWVTARDNKKHAYHTGPHPLKTLNTKNNKKTYQKRKRVIELYERGNMSHRKIADLLKIGKTTVGKYIKEKDIYDIC